MFKGLLLLLAAWCAACSASGYMRHPIVSHVHKHHALSSAPSHHRWLTPHYYNKHSSRPRASSPDSPTVPSIPTGGNVYPVAIYWAELEIGTPGRRFPAAIDSGSFTLNVAGKGCQGCTFAAPNNPTGYDASSSSSSQLETCSIFKGCRFPGGQCRDKVCSWENTYETCAVNLTEPCTITGPWYQDKVAFGGAGPVDLIFGSIQTQTSNFLQFHVVDGVVGMAGPPIQESLIGQLAKQDAVPAYMWSICFNNAGTSSNGTLVLGGVDDRLKSGPVNLTADVGGGEFYEIGVNSMDVDGVEFQAPSTFILDTGTNVLLLPDVNYRSLAAAFQKMCSQGKNLTGICGVSKTLFDGACFHLTPAEVAAFPTIHINSPGVRLDTPPEAYLLPGYGQNTPADMFCLGVVNTGAGGEALAIIGDTTFQQYLTVFDKQNSQIGFAPVNAQNCGGIGGPPSH